jgi:plasmid stabilization system protein ParE
MQQSQSNARAVARALEFLEFARNSLPLIGGERRPVFGRIERVLCERASRGTPYVIAYRVEPDAVVILRLLHGAQNWPSKL